MPSRPQPIVFLRNKIDQVKAARRLNNRAVLLAVCLLLCCSILLVCISWRGTFSQPQTADMGIPAIMEQEARQTTNQPLTVPDSMDVTGEVRAVKPSAINDGPGIWPLSGEVQQEFGWQQNPIYGEWRYHNGIDILASKGQEVHVAWDGVIAEVYTDARYGTTVAVKSAQRMVYYASLGQAFVQADTSVKAGQVVGIVGITPVEPYIHLHFAVKENERYIDPRTVIK